MKLDKQFYISEKDWYQLQAWAQLAHDEDKNEISGLMTAIPQKDGRFKLSDVEILKQENTMTNTTLDGDAVAEYKMKYAMKYKNNKMKYVWWHSHHTMDAFWSGTDKNEINAWENDSFSLALVINLKEEYKFRISFWKASGLSIEQHYDIPLTIERPAKTKITEAMKTLYKELCENDSIIVSNDVKSWNRGFIRNYNPMQNNLWEQNEADVNMEKGYSDLLESIEEASDSFLQGDMEFKQFKQKVKDWNKIAEDNKFPFKLKDELKSFGKQKLIDLLTTSFPDDLIKFDDKSVEAKLTNINYWGGMYGC